MESSTLRKRHGQPAPPETQEHRRQRWLQLMLQRTCRTALGAQIASRDAEIMPRTLGSGPRRWRSLRCASTTPSCDAPGRMT